MVDEDGQPSLLDFESLTLTGPGQQILCFRLLIGLSGPQPNKRTQ